MPRKKTIRTNLYPYHIVSRSNQKQWFQLEMNKVWALSLRSLKIAAKKHPVNCHAFVLMSNHYHLVIDTPDSNVDLFMYEFNKNFSIMLRDATNLINRMLGGRYRWSLIKSREHYLNVLKYVYLNPNKAGIVNDASVYPFSTLYQDFDPKEFPLKMKSFVNLDDKRFVEWVNRSHSPEQSRSIQKGLHYGDFSYRKTDSGEVPEFDAFLF